MSRIGKMPIELPDGVEIKVAKNNLVTVKGPMGELSEKISEKMKIAIEGNVLTVDRPNDTKINRSLHGLSRTLINNMVVGVTKGYEKKLKIIGVGYRVAKKGNALDFNLGFSHPLEMPDPEGITTEVPNQTEIVVKGISKQLVGNYAAIIRGLRPPEPYKGKGIRYENEQVRRKEGKAGK
ncbi:MAG: 50S ribosomal protein L6 [Clostridiales bacterium]|nr:MAG: 50S ribosomal protein L6 [Clostridiales bacterium]